MTDPTTPDPTPTPAPEPAVEPAVDEADRHLADALRGWVDEPHIGRTEHVASIAKGWLRDKGL